MRASKDNDYYEAIQHPLRCFRDEMLRRGQPVLDPGGKPLAHHGRHADVYEIRSPAVRERWAIKCYTRDLTGLPGRYQALHERLLGMDCPCLVQAEYLDQGLNLRGRSFPIVKMRWIEGQRLNDHVRQVFDQPQALRHLADLWAGLASQLRRVGVVHGNLHHDHVLVGRTPNGTLALHLIDYDGIFVPALADHPPEKLGHPNFQHPQRLWQRVYNAEGDRFPHLVVATALHAVAVGGSSLWERFDNGDNLLFREQDFQEPASSAVFKALWRLHDPDVHTLTGRLLLACQGSLADVPLLEEVLGQPLTAAQEQQLDALLGPEGGPGCETFALGAEDAVAGQEAGRFDLVVDDEPVLALPEKTAPPPLPCAPAEVLATAVFDKGAGFSLPKVAAVELPLATIVVEPEDGPRVAVYHLEAWMPEQIAVIKLQGFVRAEEGEVVESLPGLVRVELLDRYSVPAEASGPGLLSWFGLAQQPRPEPRVLAKLDLHLRQKDTGRQRLLDVTVRIRPGEDADPDELDWPKYCDRLFCNLRGYLMGNP